MGASGLLHFRVHSRCDAQAGVFSPLHHWGSDGVRPSTAGSAHVPPCLALPSEGFVDELEHALKAGNAKGNLVYDAQIAALCRQQGFDEILTNDLDFGRFPNLRVSRLSAGSA